MSAARWVRLPLDDALQIHDVLARYAHCIDNRDWDRLPLIFTTDAQFGAPGNYTQSRDEIADRIERVAPYHPHFTTDTVIARLPADSTGRERARSWSKYLIVRHDGSLASGDYLDEWVRTNQGWRINQRRVSRGQRWENDPGGPSQRDLGLSDFLTDAS